MSEIYEGIVCKAKKAELEEFLSAEQTVAFELKAVNSEIILILFEGRERRFYEGAALVAVEISRRFHKALLFQYDSRVGHRASTLFVDGKMNRSFDATDEKYLILDESGHPDANAEPVYYSEMLDGEEYETAKNAIDLGLERLAANLSWSFLRDILEDG